MNTNRERQDESSPNSGAARRPADVSARDDDPRLLAAVQEYMAALEAGKRPSRKECLARYPDIAEQLSACLDGLALVHSAAGQMQGIAADLGGLGGRGVDGVPASERQLGDFKLVREVGRGGMGVVYEAVQLSLGRQVAVKVLPFAATLDPRHLQRFRNEAQAAAQLHHTNIVPIYAVGCERSVHYYAMQLIDGQSLAEVIRELRQKAGRQPEKHSATQQSAETRSAKAHGPHGGWSSATTVQDNPTSPEPVAAHDPTGDSVLHLRSSAAGLSTVAADHLSVLRSSKRSGFYQAVARLGLQAAEALGYAHNQGVVHRDIKPENLLLDARGNLWVTDFGLAQFYAESNLTQTGDLLGTLRYMSPEQASGRPAVLDQRTDVYSLGLTLYELLTLERAMPGESREQLLRQIGTHEPRSPRLIDKAIPPELVTILAKATAKEPADRYATATALADDLRRFLQDEPILARPPSLWDKTVKWTRRHKSVAIAAVVVLMLATVALLISTLLIANAYERERDKAIEATEQRARAEKSSKQAREVVGFFSRIAAEDMDNPMFGEVRKAMLEASVAYYQSFIEDHEDDATVGAELDAARSRVAVILSELSAFEALFQVQMRQRLLSEESVRRDLKLSPEQIELVRKLGDDRSRQPWSGSEDLRQMTTEQKRDQFSKMAVALETDLERILTPSKAERLRQLYRQSRGVDAFTDSEISKGLSLTREQREKIRGIQVQMRDAGRRPGPGGPGRGDMEQLQKDAVKNILSRLTPDQAGSWNAMIGEPFTGTFFSRDRGSGPPRRGP